MSDEIVIVFKMDGDQWCCHFFNFTNPQEDIAGFGGTKKEALEDLLEKLGDDLS